MKINSTLSRVTLGAILLTTQFALAQKPGPKPPLQPPSGPTCPKPELHRQDDNASYSSLGIDGRSGFSGSNGLDGRTPQAQTISAVGVPMQINLRGGDGSDASDGQDGQDASCSLRDPFHDRINYNIQQPNGGAGGDAGRPGNAGSGGDATIYFTDLKQLKLIYIDASPGNPGEGARAGRGGRGCFCNYRSWETNSFENFTRIVGDQKLSCSEPVQTTHYCKSGTDGSNGRATSYGFNGRLGSMTLIKRAQPLPKNNTSASLELTQAASSKIILLRNIFESRAGANSLLANGSIVDDTYSAYVTTAVLPIQLVWKARKPISEFAGTTVSYSLDSNGQSASINTSAWTSGRADLVNGTQVFTIDRALLQQDATRLSVAISGNGRNTLLTITDDASVSDLIDQTQVSLNLDSKGVFSHDRFDGLVPAANIRQEGNKYIINLYDIWMLKNDQKQSDGDLKKGKVVKADISVTRSMNGKSAYFRINLDKYKLTDGLAIKN